MAQEQPGRELPQRVRGAARTGPPPPAPSSSPVLTEELRQRMRAAVTAERSGAATKQDEAPAVSEPPAAATPPFPVKPPAGPAPADSPRPAGPAPADSPRPAGRSRARRVAPFVAVVLVIGMLAVAAVRYFGRSPAASPPSAAAARQAAEARAAAASWVAQQVSRDVKVSCDPAMCAALSGARVPLGANCLVLGSNSADPDQLRRGSRDAAVLSLFGSSLATGLGAGGSRVLRLRAVPRHRPGDRP